MTKRFTAALNRLFTRSHLPLGLSLLGLSLLLAHPPGSKAATLTVNSTADDGTGVCTVSKCTLRDAIISAVSGDTITFSLRAKSTISLTNGELLINKNLTINGPGANLLTVQRSTVSGTPTFRIFHIDNITATISGLTIANGNHFTSMGENRGGGIFNNGGTLTLSNSTISGNAAPVNRGGGIFNKGGTLTLSNSTVSGNSSNGGGGGIFNLGIFPTGTLTVINSTISGNSTLTDRGLGLGGGILNEGGTGGVGRVILTNSTISGNTAQYRGGGIASYETGGSGGFRLRNTIIALNSVTASGQGPDVFSEAELTSEGFTLIGNNSGATIIGDLSDQIGVTAAQLNLGPLQDNGGPTKTHALLSGSTAIDKGHSSRVSTDQRGFARPVDDPVIANGGDGSDIGAYEVPADLLPGCNAINGVVNNNSDNGAGSLRAVIASVCAGTTITFAPNVSGAITLTSGELLINKTLTINGPGANQLTVQRSTASGTPAFRIFHIANIGDINTSATISGLTIANGNSADGGGIFNDEGTLTLTHSAISANRATSRGGGIHNTAFHPLTIMNCTISGNMAGLEGGGIYNYSGPVTITNSTASGNSAGSSGGGIFNRQNTVTVTNSTISANTAGNNGGGIFDERFAGLSATLLRNTIIARNTAPNGLDIGGQLISRGFNLIGNASGATITPVTGDQIGNAGLPVDPLLGSLQNNGGPLQTHALLSGSTAIDKGHSSGASTDQRGFTRPVDASVIANAGDGSDIGAYEVQADLLPGCDTVVNNNNDSGAGSLRAVIAGACAGTTITFAPNVRGTITLTSGQLVIDKTLTINGPGANQLTVQRSTVSGVPTFRIFNIGLNINSTISGLTIANGNSPAGGGGIFNNAGTLALRNSAISRNTASLGGGIYNQAYGTVTIINSTVSGNTTTEGNGGGIFISETTGTVNVINSTISGNSASQSSFGFGSGGGIFNTGGTLTLTNSTISGNTAQFRGGGIFDDAFLGGAVTSRNTIIALNTALSGGGPDVWGTVTSLAFNLIGNNKDTTISPVQSDQIGTAGSPIDPLLGALQDNGGPTLTRTLLSGSTAIDKGHSSGSTTDQRSFTRPVGIASVSGGDGSDIGAFEMQLNCAYSINPISQAFPSSGGTNSVNVTATAGCTWTAHSNSPSFITTTSGASGTGSGTVNYSVAANTSASQRTGTITIAGQTFTVTQDSTAPTPTPTPMVSTLQFSATNYNGAEDCAAAVVTVTRTGDSNGVVSVDYATSDGSALQRTDYTIALGTLSFASGETSRSFTVLITEDSYVEGTETATITLSNPTSGAVLGSLSTATVAILDDATESATNPIDVAGNYVCQHYHDFLNREPDAAGLAFWTDQITSCGSDAQCIEIRRINVSAAYFLSIEFQQTGYLVYRFYNAALNRPNGLPRYLEFLRDTQGVGRGVVVGATGWEAQLETNKIAFAGEFAGRAEFTSLYPLSQTPVQYVDALYAHAGITPSAAERQLAIDEFNNPTLARARVLRRVAENQAYSQREFNKAFVLMQYFGYMRRSPGDLPDTDLSGYNFWLGKLNQFGGNFVNAEMVKAFITSGEYRQRFGAN